MTNFIQLCYLPTDFHSKTPKLPVEKINPETNKARYCGELSWLDGKTKEGKTKYQKLRFFTFDRKIFDLMLQNSASGFNIKGFIKTSTKKNSKGEFEAFYVDIQVIEASIHQKEKISPQHWQQ